jgi:hypothetical protein
VIIWLLDMTKNLQNSICTRYRPFVTVLMTVGLFGILIGFGFLFLKRGNNRLDSPYYKAKLLSVGMTEPELIKIMGKPLFTRIVDTHELNAVFPGAAEAIKEVKLKYARVTEFTFAEKRRFGETGVLSVSGIYLDEKQKEIVLLQPLPGLLDQIPAGDNEAFLLIATCLVVPWIGLHFWCKRRLKKRNLHSGVDLSSKV